MVPSPFIKYHRPWLGFVSKPFSSPACPFRTPKANQKCRPNSKLPFPTPPFHSQFPAIPPGIPFNGWLFPTKARGCFLIFFFISPHSISTRFLSFRVFTRNKTVSRGSKDFPPHSWRYFPRPSPLLPAFFPPLISPVSRVINWDSPPFGRFFREFPSPPVILSTLPHVYPRPPPPPTHPRAVLGT